MAHLRLLKVLLPFHDAAILVNPEGCQPRLGGLDALGEILVQVNESRENHAPTSLVKSDPLFGELGGGIEEMRGDPEHRPALAVGAAHLMDVVEVALLGEIGLVDLFALAA